MAKDINFVIKEDYTEKLLTAEDAAIDRALTKIGILVEGAAKINITKNKSVDTGRLRASITYAAPKKSSSTKSPASSSDKVPMKPRSKEKAVYIGTNVEYAPYVEYGTYKQTAKPYLKPAVESNRNEIKQIIEEELGK